MNVGGGGKLRMTDLKAWLEDEGFAGVQTYIASGNAVIDGPDGTDEDLEARLEAGAQARLGLRTVFFVRRPPEWDALIAANPFPEEAATRPSRLVAMCLKSELAGESLAYLASAITGPERIAAAGRTLYIDFPEGQGVSKLDRDWARAKVPPLGTARNWNTVLKLAALAAA